mgnify:CR=1 FL=1
MILTEQEIKAILEKSPKLMKSKFGDSTINQFEYNQKELLDLIQTYIKERKNIDVGEIKLQQGMCPSFVNLMIQKGVNPLEAMQKADIFNAFDYASWVAMNYYFNKFKEK